MALDDGKGAKPHMQEHRPMRVGDPDSAGSTRRPVYMYYSVLSPVRAIRIPVYENQLSWPLIPDISFVEVNSIFTKKISQFILKCDVLMMFWLI